MNIKDIAEATLAKGNRTFLKPEEVNQYTSFVVVKGRTQEFDSDFSETGKRTAILADLDCMDAEGVIVDKKTLDVSRWKQTMRYFLAISEETDEWVGKVVELKQSQYTDTKNGGVVRQMIVPKNTKEQATAEGC